MVVEDAPGITMTAIPQVIGTVVRPVSIAAGLIGPGPAGAKKEEISGI
jgi:hypothetical protein